jgi:hypothetical protein
MSAKFRVEDPCVFNTLAQEIRFQLHKVALAAAQNPGKSPNYVKNTSQILAARHVIC